MLRRQKIRRIRPVSRISSNKKSGSFLGKFLFLIFLSVVIYFVFFSEFFLVQSIKTDGEINDGGVLSSKIVQSLSDVRGKNLVFLNTNNLQKRLMDLFPDFEKITVYKSFPKTVKVGFSRFPDSANVIYESPSVRSVFIINTIGMVVKSDAEKPNLPFIRLQRDEPVNVEETLIEKSKLNYILESKTYFEDKFGMNVKELVYKPHAREVHLLTERNFEIWLDIQKDFESQFKKLKKAATILDIYKEDLLYIDLRIAGSVGDRIIYKRR
ncbi:MAG: hypothetical protein RBS56_02770 [Candidatus Gracilibacteria bacterium]|jgi:hypothetical protein|nr:hypothetical protein [Candidatus Gracilibacteria bacterium]